MLDLWNSDVLEFLLSTLWLIGALAAWYLLDSDDDGQERE